MTRAQLKQLLAQAESQGIIIRGYPLTGEHEQCTEYFAFPNTKQFAGIKGFCETKKIWGDIDYPVYFTIKFAMESWRQSIQTPPGFTLNLYGLDRPTRDIVWDKIYAAVCAWIGGKASYGPDSFGNHIEATWQWSSPFNQKSCPFGIDKLKELKKLLEDILASLRAKLGTN